MIPLDECVDGRLYRIHSRNLSFGVFQKKSGGFIGIREKFGNEYLFAEYHYDTGAPFGTVYPKKELESLPEDIELAETLGTVDENGKKVIFDKSRSEGGKGWYDPDTGESCNTMPCSVSNQKLFQWLKEKEEQYKDELND
jgi:hypothetical protein